ncbi:MAG: hypothetical protein FWD09_00750, partial [Lentimicrobiaceae bacterium]|nr:hypothetical protein [Lentimicrobiaceae bacterium]
MKTSKTFTLLLATLLATSIYAQTVTLDPTFGENGMTVIPGGGFFPRIKFDMAGNIFALGVPSLDYDPFIVKTDAHGTIDSSFGINGIAHLRIFPIGMFDFKITNENKILFVGGELFNALIIQLNEDGSMDSSFGNNGEIVLDINYTVSRVNLESDDSMLIVGDNIITKYNYNGELDHDFGIDGKVIWKDLGLPDNPFPTCIKISNDQSILVAGASHNDDHKSPLWFLKMGSNGSLVTNFADDGIWKMETSTFSVFFDNIIEDKNGNLLLTGYANNSFMCSFSPNGVINSNFGMNGFYYFDDLWPDFRYKKMLQYGNKYLIGSYDQLICVNNDGSLDNSFNDTGLFICDGFTFADMKLQEIDKLILGGRNSNGNFLLTRLNIPPAVSVKEQDNSFATQVI